MRPPPDDREQKLNDLIMRFRKSQVPEMHHFARTMSKWCIEISNSLTTFGCIYKLDPKNGRTNAYQKRMTNAIIENRKFDLQMHQEEREWLSQLGQIPQSPHVCPG